MSHWLAELDHLLGTGDVVRIVVATVRGSAPREAGACLLVYRDGVLGTIGGGRLEQVALELARDLLARPRSAARCERYVLGASLGQCCGGIVELWWERFGADERALVADAARRLRTGTPLTLVSAAGGRLLLDADGSPLAAAGAPVALEPLRAPLAALTASEPVRLVGGGDSAVLLERLRDDATPLWLFGAGHVGKALVAVLRDLPFAITWVDSRPDVFPPTLPDNVVRLHHPDPARAAADVPNDACVLVLTHSHEQDFDICRALLAQDHTGFLGLIGSRPKAVRFAQRLGRAGIPSERIGRITCPIGIGGIDSKLPAAIAVAVAAQLLQLRQQAAAGRPEVSSKTV